MEEELVFSGVAKDDTNGGGVAATDVTATIPVIEGKEEAMITHVAISAGANAEENKELTNGGHDEPVAPIAECPPPRHSRSGRKRAGFSLFRAVLMTFTSKSSNKNAGNINVTDEKVNVAAEKPMAAVALNETKWKSFVDGVRPLHLNQLDYYPPPPPLGHEAYHDVLLPPPSPARSEGAISRYASAQDLEQLGGSEDEEDDDAPGEGDGRPNEIDMQAEEFIAKFYAQMRLQESLDNAN